MEIFHTDPWTPSLGGFTHQIFTLLVVNKKLLVNTQNSRTKKMRLLLNSTRTAYVTSARKGVAAEQLHPYKINARWFLVKSMVILLVVASIVGLVTISEWELFTRRATRPDGTFHTVQTTAHLTAIRHFNSTLHTSTPTSDSDSNDNTKICNKISSYELDQCEFARENCMAPLGGGILDYVVIRYCQFGGLAWLFYVVMALWLSFLFYMLSCRLLL